MALSIGGSSFGRDRLLAYWHINPCAAAILREIRRRERELGIQPDADLDGYLKASAMAGQRSNAGTLLIMRLLGLEVRPLLPSHYLYVTPKRLTFCDT
jgi:hypothetical protein